MSVSRGESAAGRRRRGQSTLMGIVLLFGMVAAGSLGIFLIAGEAMSGAEQQSEQERIEQAFIELSNSISSSTVSADVSQSMELHAGDRGAIAHHDSATYEIWANDSENRTNISSGTIGTIEYESDDGTKVAYEGGAVFRETGERTQILSSPPLGYDHGTSTLSFPVVTLTEDKTIHSGEIQLKQTDVDRESMNYIQNDHVFVEITSEYCLGWESYFTEQVGDTTLQESCYGGENEDGTVKVRLGYDDIDNAFSSGVGVPDEGNINDGHDTFDNISSGIQYQPMDETISMITEDFENDSAEHINNSGTHPAGEYYAEEIHNPDLEFNLNDGDAILAVDGDILLDGDDSITVTDCGPNGDNQLQIYMEGDLVMSDGAIEPDCDGDGGIKTIQVYGTSTSGIDFHSNPTYEGLLYAASDEDPDDDGFGGWPIDESHNNRDDDYQVNFQGNPNFDGSVIAHSINVDSKVGKVDDISLSDTSDVDPIPEGYEPAPQLTYLNLAEHEIQIKNN